MADLSTYQQKFSIIGDDAPNLSPGYAEAIYDDAGIWGGHYSLSDHLKSGIDDRLAGSPPASYLPVFDPFAPADEDEGDSRYNSDLWGGKGTDLNTRGWLGVVWWDVSAVPPDNVLGGLGNGVPITRRHILTPEHGTHSEGDTVRWILSDGTFVDRDIIKARTFVGGTTNVTSFRVMLLDSDLPATIPIFRMFHPEISGELDLVGLPVVAINQDEKAAIFDVSSTDTDKIYITESEDATRASYYVNITTGDSGSPMFVVYGSELIYLSGLAEDVGSISRAPNGLKKVGAIASAVTSLNEEYSLTGYEMNYLNVDLE